MANEQQIPSCKCPTEDDCPRDYDLVCGSDGKTYINLCRLQVEACTTGKPVRMIKKGVCGKAKILLNETFQMLMEKPAD